MIASIIYFIVNQGISSSMGQDNKTILSNEQQLLKMFTIIDKIKEQNITYLEHLNDHKPFILREAIYNIEKQQQQAIAKIKSREHFNSPFLTNLVSNSTYIQDSKHLRNKDSAPNTSEFFHSGNSPEKRWLWKITNVPFPGDPIPHSKSEFC